MAEEERPPHGPDEDNVIHFPTVMARQARESQPAQEVIKDMYENREGVNAVLIAAIRDDGTVDFGLSNMAIGRAIWLATYIRLRIEKEMHV